MTGDGFHHPSSEAELAALVRTAHQQGRRVRVRGAAHSVGAAIYTDSADGPDRVHRQDAPANDDLDVMLDRYRGCRVIDAREALVEVEAGIHIGADPFDPAGPAPIDHSLLHALDREGWMLSNTGGITHQTISGFIATGSAGGSVRYSANDNLHAFRLIDGRGDVHEFVRGRDPEFEAMCPNLGLLGIVSRITLKCRECFAIAGEEVAHPVATMPIDLLGQGDGRPSLEAFLRTTDFARIEWWPQRGLEHAVIWRARALAPGTPFTEARYDRFAGDDDAAQHLIAVLYSLLGNLGDITRAKATLEDNFDELARVFDTVARERDLGVGGRLVAKLLARLAEGSVDTAYDVLAKFAPRIEQAVPDLFPKLAGEFITGGPQEFTDWAWRALPMDNAVNDIVIPTSFTEVWIPLPLTQRVMTLVADHFNPSDDHEAYRRTGTFVWEIYAAKPCTFWLNPSYTDSRDEWRDGALRINPYWYSDNAEEPARTLFAGFWDLLRRNGIPFRLHWGKVHPHGRPWAEFIAGQYPRWDDFLALRERLDPDDVFLTAYWRDRLGL